MSWLLMSQVPLVAAATTSTCCLWLPSGNGEKGSNGLKWTETLHSKWSLIEHTSQFSKSTAKVHVIRMNITCQPLWASSFGRGIQIGVWLGLTGQGVVHTLHIFWGPMSLLSSWSVWGARDASIIMGTAPMHVFCLLGSSCLVLCQSSWRLHPRLCISNTLL